ncbi:energy transducer TonB [Neorhodopirellula pilleata]|uniref:energy transducer TonB n=1 Tax=Neorhodopirellula pilleata TaxID=2714738 RepID=UPI0011B3CCD4|nr:energy transducer TonB [Neorhodopirellula pilleata]
MNHTHSILRSTTFSIGLHLTVLATIAIVPLSSLERFSTRGTRQITAIELTLTCPTPAASVSVVTIEVSSQQFESQPTARRFVEQEKLHREETASPPLGLPEIIADAVSPTEPLEILRMQTPPDQPKVVEKQFARPRRPVTVSMIPPMNVISPMNMRPLESLAGLSETHVEFTSNPPPKYPANAAVNRIEGNVLLKLFVNARGIVERVEIVRSSGHDILDDAARNAVSRWRGKPATRQGRPVASTEVLPIRFRL